MEPAALAADSRCDRPAVVLARVSVEDTLLVATAAPTRATSRAAPDTSLHTAILLLPTSPPPTVPVSVNPRGHPPPSAAVTPTTPALQASRKTLQRRLPRRAHQPAAAGALPDYGYKARALYAYQANADDPTEISFSKGEVLDIVDNSGKWWQARKSNGDTGIVPSNYVSLL